jgi:hypothetical protein
VTERRSPKRTRTVTVRPGRYLARSRLATLSARRRSAGIRTRSSAGFLPSADCAPADRARRCVLICRGSRFQASAVSFSEAAGPSNRVSDRSEIFASCPMLSTPISASRALVTGPTPTLARPADCEGSPTQWRGRLSQGHRAWPLARQFSPSAWCAPHRPRLEGQALCAPGAEQRSQFRLVNRRDGCTPRRRRRPHRSRFAQREA